MSDQHSTERPTLRIVREQPEFAGKQGLRYAAGISAETVGAKGIHMQILRMPPGAKAKAHRHEAHETAIYILSGRSGVWFGEEMENHAVAGEGDFVYIAAGVPHLPYNDSQTEPCIAVIARTDPNEQESVVLMPHLDALAAKEPA